jgi:hypothetical protein
MSGLKKDNKWLLLSCKQKLFFVVKKEQPFGCPINSEKNFSRENEA